MTTTEATLRNLCGKIGVVVEFYGESTNNFTAVTVVTFAARFRVVPKNGYSRVKEVKNVPIDVDLEDFMNVVLKSIE